MGNSSYFRFDDDNKTKYIYILSQSSQQKWVNWKHTAPHVYVYHIHINLKTLSSNVYISWILKNSAYRPIELFIWPVAYTFLLQHLIVPGLLAMLLNFPSKCPLNIPKSSNNKCRFVHFDQYQMFCGSHYDSCVTLWQPQSYEIFK